MATLIVNAELSSELNYAFTVFERPAHMTHAGKTHRTASDCQLYTEWSLCLFTLPLVQTVAEC
jgi:hypothetical protein